jgi:hypothetical protein
MTEVEYIIKIQQESEARKILLMQMTDRCEVLTAEKRQKDLIINDLTEQLKRLEAELIGRDFYEMNLQQTITKKVAAFLYCYVIHTNPEAMSDDRILSEFGHVNDSLWIDRAEHLIKFAKLEDKP